MKKVNLNSFINNDASHLPLPIGDLEGLSLSELPLGNEVVPYDSIIDGQHLLKGYHITLTRVSLNKVVIGCTEIPAYHTTGDDDFFPISCQDFINEYFTTISLSKAA